jgi:hypothetical protein
MHNRFNLYFRSGRRNQKVLHPTDSSRAERSPNAEYRSYAAAWEVLFLTHARRRGRCRWKPRFEQLRLVVKIQSASARDSLNFSGSSARGSQVSRSTRNNFPGLLMVMVFSLPQRRCRSAGFLMSSHSSSPGSRHSSREVGRGGCPASLQVSARMRA